MCGTKMEEYDIIETIDGTIYYKKGTTIIHRLDGPAIEHISGIKSWYLDGERHRLDGPAIEIPDIKKEWFVNGKRHRLDGPAVEVLDKKTIQGWLRKGKCEWWVNGCRLSPEKEKMARLWWENAKR